MKNLLTLLFVLTNIFAFGQNRKTLTMSDFEAILKNPENHQSLSPFGQFKNLDFIWDEKKDAHLIARFDEYGDMKKSGGIQHLKMDKHASFMNCTFSQLIIKNSENVNITFNECTIGELDIRNCSGKMSFNEITCTPETFKYWHYGQEQGFFECNNLSLVFRAKNSEYAKPAVRNSKLNKCVIINVSQAFLINNTIRGETTINGDNAAIELKNNIIIIDSLLTIPKPLLFNDFGEAVAYNYSDINRYYPSAVNISGNYKEANIFNNHFTYEGPNKDLLKENVYNYNFESANFSSFNMFSENVQRINFNNATFDKSITIDSTSINKDFSAENVILTDYNNHFIWSTFKKLTLRVNDTTLYNLDNYEAAKDVMKYNLYISTLNKFFQLFKTQGDLESSNLCYVEMKNAETQRLKFLYETEGGIKNLLNYNLNRFLKFFAEYGTSPVRSVQISGWVILIFASFYFFFYSDWDRINRKFLINRGEKLISYFRSEQKLEDLYSDKHKEDINTFSQFKQNLKESKTEVPFFFMLFLKPLYWVSVIKHQFNSFLYKRVEFLQGRWVDLSRGKKSLIGLATFITILTYGVYLIAVRSLNSLILSINTFTTLGFGDIPVVGVSRYVAILEGFLGWFLLSIFSVSLISQILQN